MKSSRIRQTFVAVAALLVGLLLAAPAAGQLRVGSLCRVKGQEGNTLQGWGLVVGLKGTGDGDKPTTRMLAHLVRQMSNSIGQKNGQAALEELKDVKNVAQVMVTAHIRGQGAREGGEVDCRVSAISAKSLEGGVLLMTPLLGPRPDDNTVYAMAQGPIRLENRTVPTTGKVTAGARLLQDFYTPYVHNGQVTLVLHNNHAGFAAAQDIEDLINDQPDFRESFESSGEGIAAAIDATNIVVNVPSKYAKKPVQFVNSLLSLRMISPAKDATVVINERSGVIIVGDNVELRPVMVQHRNLTINAGGTAVNQFVPLDPGAAANATTKLKALVDALNALKVPTDDMIQIIKELDRGGDLFGRLIVK